MQREWYIVLQINIFIGHTMFSFFIKKYLFKYIFLLFVAGCLFGLCTKSYAQDSKLTRDSLKLYYDLSLWNDTSKESITNRGLRLAEEMDYVGWQVKFRLNKTQLNLENNQVESAISNAFIALNLIQTEGVGMDQEGRVHSLLTQGLIKIGAYEDAIHHRREQLNWVVEKGDEATKFVISRAIGTLFLQLNENDSALYHFKQVENFANQANYSRLKASVQNDIGLVFMNLNNVDSARKYFLIAYDYFKKPETGADTLMLGIVGGNLSASLSLKNQSTEIKDLLNQDIQITKKFPSRRSLAKVYANMAEYQLKIGDRKRALYYLGLAEVAFPSRKYKGEKDAELLRIYDLYKQVYQAMNNYEEALFYANESRELYDLLFGKEVYDKLALSRSAYHVSSIQQDLQLKDVLLKSEKEKVKLLEREEELSKLKSTFILFSGIFLLTIVILIMIKMRGDHRKKGEIERLSKKLLEENIEQKKQRLRQTSLSLARKKEFAEELINKLIDIDSLDRKQLSPIKLFVNNELQLDESILETEDFIAELNKDFFVKVKFQFPHLTENDLKLCALISLKMTIKQMAIIKNITPASVKIAKNRLRKKMDLETGTSLNEYMKQF